MKKLITPSVYNLKGAKNAFNQNYTQIYCIASDYKEVTKVVTTLKEAELFFNTFSKKDTKLLTKFKKFTKEEIAQRFLNWSLFGRQPNKNE